VIGAMDVYRCLLAHFGSQGWWPTTPKGSFSPVYHSKPKVNHLSETEKFEICVGAILTQNTAWTNVQKALLQLNQARLMSPEKIERTPFNKLARLIRSSGYFRQKAKKLKFYSSYLIKNYMGKVSILLKKPLPLLREELLGLYGLGPETVDSIMLYAGGVPTFVVDAYTRRIGNRIGLFHTENYQDVQTYFEHELKKSAALFNQFHALLVALGKNICRTKPDCTHCPLREDCKTGKRAA